MNWRAPGLRMDGFIWWLLLGTALAVLVWLVVEIVIAYLRRD